MKFLFISLFSIFLMGCSAVGNSKTEIAPYQVIESEPDSKIELRTYDQMVLVSTSMNSAKGNSAFRKLFKYISGDNIDQSKIPMTAPVFMDEENKDYGKKIPMTAPVFMDENSETPMMSFVMPREFTLETTPKPTDPEVMVSEIKNYTVAVIQFNGTLSDTNVKKHEQILEEWIEDQEYEIIGSYKKAGYNAPFTLPMLRRNEVLIEVKKP